MGYTHYWYRTKEIDANTFVKIKMDFERVLPVLAEAGIKLGNGYGLGFPIMDGETIQFNAPGEQGYESMYFPRILLVHPDQQPNQKGHYFDFCKTNRRPYDLAITLFLLIAKHHLQDDLILHSDGGTDAWEAAEQLFERVFTQNHSHTK